MAYLNFDYNPYVNLLFIFHKEHISRCIIKWLGWYLTKKKKTEVEFFYRCNYRIINYSCDREKEMFNEMFYTKLILLRVSAGCNEMFNLMFN